MFGLSVCLSVFAYSSVEFSLASVGMASSVLHIQENSRHCYRIERPLLLIPVGVCMCGETTCCMCLVRKSAWSCGTWLLSVSMHALTSISEVYIFGDSFVFFFFLCPMFVLVLIFYGLCVWVSVWDCVCGCENILTCRCIIAIKAEVHREKNNSVSVFIFIKVKDKQYTWGHDCHLIPHVSLVCSTAAKRKNKPGPVDDCSQKAQLQTKAHRVWGVGSDHWRLFCETLS